MERELLQSLERLVSMTNNGFKIFNSEDLKQAEELIKKCKRRLK